MGVAAAGREQDAYELGRVTALEGRAVGIHLDFAPVADVNNNPANPIINTRSFGEDPHAVARFVAAEVRGIQDNGMLATAKHFPGHGNTGTDSHLAVPVITATWPELDSVELVPFRAAIAAGVAGVMSAHIAMPGIDSDVTRPGTLSPRILTGLLQDSLGFRGLVVTDAINMGGLANRVAKSQGEAAVLAFLAGADLLLQPTDPTLVIDAMEEAVRSGRIPEERLDRSLRKLFAIKAKLGLFRRRTVSLDSVTAVVGAAEFQREARDLAARAVVLAGDSGGAVDSLRARRSRVTVIAFGDETSPTAGATLVAELRRLGDTVTTFRLQPASGPASYDSARVALAASPRAVFAIGVRYSAFRGTIAMPDSLAALIDVSAAERPSVLVSFGTPYLIGQTPHVGSYLLAWVSNTPCEAAAAAALAGAPIGGRLPISIPPRYPLGAGLVRPAAAATTSAAPPEAR
jgi:beta-N-acetylhexosaminidase